jgi:hypothetical protein
MSYKNVLLIVAVILLAGCAPFASNLSPVFPRTKPQMKIIKPSSLDISQFRTFSVVPVSGLKKGPLLTNEIMELHMLFFLRNAFEFRGYRYVDRTENPDFLATIDGLVSFKPDDYLPKALTSPAWLPIQDISKTFVSARMTTQTHKIPAHSGGTVYPDIRIDVLDPDTLKPLWAGIGWAAAKNPDLRISGQTIAIFLIGEFPQGPFPCNDVAEAFGFAFYIFTNNGNDYYPTVFQVIDDSPAGKAGLMKYDMIASIDGLSVKNRPLSEIIKIFRKGSGNKRSLTLLRDNQKIDICISPLARQGGTGYSCKGE